MNIEKELGVEIVGDAKVKVSVEEDEDDYEVIEDEVVTEEILDNIDKEVKEDYLD